MAGWWDCRAIGQSFGAEGGTRSTAACELVEAERLNRVAAKSGRCNGQNQQAVPRAFGRTRARHYRRRPCFLAIARRTTLLPGAESVMGAARGEALRPASCDLDDAGALAEWIRIQEVGEAGLHFLE